MYQYRGVPYAAMPATPDEGRTYQWCVFPMPLSRGDVTPEGGIRTGSAVQRFRGPFAEQRARRRARVLSRRAAR